LKVIIRDNGGGRGGIIRIQRHGVCFSTWRELVPAMTEILGNQWSDTNYYIKSLYEALFFLLLKICVCV
jgi:hypothetical protein